MEEYIDHVFDFVIAEEVEAEVLHLLNTPLDEDGYISIIPAIKYVRSRYDWCLFDSKKYVEDVRDKHGLTTGWTKGGY